MNKNIKITAAAEPAHTMVCFPATDDCTFAMGIRNSLCNLKIFLSSKTIIEWPQQTPKKLCIFQVAS